VIRPAQASDAPAMAEVLSNWIDTTPWMPRIHTRAEDHGFCETLLRTSDVWIADTRDGIGFLAMVGDSVDALYLGPQIRRQGWGAALLDAVKPGKDRLTLWTFQANTDAIAFYKSQGFQVSELTDGQGNDEKLPDCLMTWERDMA